MEKRLLVGVLAASALLLGCGDSGTGPEDTTPNWFPEQVGSIWDYEISGTVASEGITADVSGTMNREGVAEMQHSQGFTVLQVISASEITYTPQGGGDAWTVNSSDTTYVHITDAVVEEFSSLEDAEPGIVLQLPLTVGDIWTYQESGAFDETVVSLSESITVPAGSFAECAFVQESVQGVSLDDYYANVFYADGSGIVKIVLHDVGVFSATSSDIEMDRL